MKCDVYIRKELYAISRCQVARSCSAAVPNTPRPAAVPDPPPRCVPLAELDEKVSKLQLPELFGNAS